MFLFPQDRLSSLWRSPYALSESADPNTTRWPAPPSESVMPATSKVPMVWYSVLYMYDVAGDDRGGEGVSYRRHGFGREGGGGSR